MLNNIYIYHIMYVYVYIYIYYIYIYIYIIYIYYIYHIIFIYIYHIIYISYYIYNIIYISYYIYIYIILYTCTYIYIYIMYILLSMGIKKKGHNGITPMCFHHVIYSFDIVDRKVQLCADISSDLPANRRPVADDADVFLKLSDLNSEYSNSLQRIQKWSSFLDSQSTVLSCTMTSFFYLVFWEKHLNLWPNIVH